MTSPVGSTSCSPPATTSPTSIPAGHLRDAGVAPVTANAYLGGWGIAAALGEGADIVVCGRVTDASLVVGPAAWWHGWSATDYDALAGAVAAGHIIECGPQATGGNYPWPDEIRDRRSPGFPIAEVDADGSSVITKHPDTGGLVSVGTVTAQLLYEIAAPGVCQPRRRGPLRHRAAVPGGYRPGPDHAAHAAAHRAACSRSPSTMSAATATP